MTLTPGSGGGWRRYMEQHTLHHIKPCTIHTILAVHQTKPNNSQHQNIFTILFHTTLCSTEQHMAGVYLEQALASSKQQALASTQPSPQGQRSAPCGQYGGQPLPLFLFREIDNFPFRLHMNQTRLRKLIPINIDIYMMICFELHDSCHLCELVRNVRYFHCSSAGGVDKS